MPSLFHLSLLPPLYTITSITSSVSPLHHFTPITPTLPIPYQSSTNLNFLPSVNATTQPSSVYPLDQCRCCNDTHSSVRCQRLLLFLSSLQGGRWSRQTLTHDHSERLSQIAANISNTLNITSLEKKTKKHARGIHEAPRWRVSVSARNICSIECYLERHTRALCCLWCCMNGGLELCAAWGAA